jgi:hypothetical protein
MLPDAQALFPPSIGLLTKERLDESMKQWMGNLVAKHPGMPSLVGDRGI